MCICAGCAPALPASAATAGTAPKIWNRSRRLTPDFSFSCMLRSLNLNVQLFDLIDDVLRSAPSERANCERRILVGVAHERRCIGNKEVLHVPGLAVFVENGCLWIIADLGGAHLMNDLTPAGDTPVGVRAVLAGDDSAHLLDDLLEGFLHVLGLQDLVLAPFEMEAEHRNAPFIHGIRIDFAVTVFVRDHLTASREMHIAAVQFPEVILHFNAVPAVKKMRRVTS